MPVIIGPMKAGLTHCQQSSKCCNINLSAAEAKLRKLVIWVSHLQIIWFSWIPFTNAAVFLTHLASILHGRFNKPQVDICSKSPRVLLPLCHLLWLRLKRSSSPGYKGLFTKVHHILKIFITIPLPPNYI